MKTYQSPYELAKQEKQKLKNTYQVTTDLGLEFKVVAQAMFVVFQPKEEPILINTASLAIAHLLYPKATDIREANNVVLLNSRVKDLEAEKILRR